jgi:hypothetical protein
MNSYQKLSLVLTGTSFLMMTPAVEAVTLTQSFSINLNNQPLNSSTKLLLPKFNSLLGELTKVYITMNSTVNSNINITPSGTSNFTGNSSVNADFAVNFPTLKADPTLLLKLAVDSQKTSIANGSTGNLNSSKSGSAWTTIADVGTLSALSGCQGQTIALNIKTPGGVTLNGLPSNTGSYDGNIFTNSDFILTYEYQGSDSASVPEPITIAGFGLAVAMGGWWKQKSLKKG